MGVQSGWSMSGASGFDALWNVAAASAPFWLLLGGFIGLLVRFWLPLWPRAAISWLVPSQYHQRLGLQSIMSRKFCLGEIYRISNWCNKRWKEV